MITWGIVANSHDASLAVFETKIAGLTDHYKTKLLWASLAKDFTGVPHEPHLSQKQIDIAVQSFGNPDRIIWYELPFLKTLRQWRAGQGWLWNENDIKKYLSQYNFKQNKIEYTKHHLSHAAYAYYTQPHDDVAVVCLDSIGEFETLTVWHGKDNKLKKVHSQGYPHSLGLFYSAMTQRLGLVAQRDEYMIADMAKKAGPNHLKYTAMILNELVDMRIGNPKIRMRENLHRGCNWWHEELNSEQDMFDLAAATQKVFEACVAHITMYAYQKTGAKHLALAGGGAMNKQAVDKIRSGWHSVWVPPNPGDPGSCIGAVLAKTKEKIVIDNQWYKAV